MKMILKDGINAVINKSRGKLVNITECGDGSSTIHPGLQVPFAGRGFEPRLHVIGRFNTRTDNLGMVINNTNEYF